MLRVGLTGGLGSGKSTAGAMLAKRGAQVLQADEIGRDLMQPGKAVYRAIVERFGPGVVRGGGRLGGDVLDRAELARMAFGEGRVEELNAIVHPAVIARQAALAEEIGRREPRAVVVVESALIFETRFGAGWRERFDRLVLVTADDETKVRRYVGRVGGGRSFDEDRADLEAEARRRLASQMRDEAKAAQSDYVIRNEGTIEALEEQVSRLWESLRRDEAAMEGEEGG